MTAAVLLLSRQAVPLAVGVAALRWAGVELGAVHASGRLPVVRRLDRVLVDLLVQALDVLGDRQAATFDRVLQAALVVGGVVGVPGVVLDPPPRELVEPLARFGFY